MGQSSSGSAQATSFLPGPQQKLASDVLGSKTSQKIIANMPTDTATKARFAGKLLSGIGGTVPDTATEDSQSYAHTYVKRPGTYTQYAAMSQQPTTTTG